MSAWTYRCQSAGKTAQKIVPLRSRTPCWKGIGADSEEKREPVSDVDTAMVDSLKVLDPKWPIREEALVKPGLVTLLDLLFDRRCVRSSNLVREDAAKRGERAFGDSPVRIPQLRPDHCLAALKENPLHADIQCCRRHPALRCQRRQQLRIDGDFNAAIDAQGLAESGHEKQQPDVRIFDDVH